MSRYTVLQHVLSKRPRKCGGSLLKITVFLLLYNAILDVSLYPLYPIYHDIHYYVVMHVTYKLKSC